MFENEHKLLLESEKLPSNDIQPIKPPIEEEKWEIKEEDISVKKTKNKEETISSLKNII